MIEQHLHIKDPTYSVITFKASELPEQYKALVFSKWLRSLRYGNPLFEKADSNEYYKNYHIFIENLFKKPDALVHLAVLTDDHDVVLGFSATREDVLDYVHVHRDMRRQGIAKKLIPSSINVFSHMTKIIGSILTHNPKYKLRDPSKMDDPAVRYFTFNPFA
jgi:GNAT superfamily N-acetyltransferase